MVKLQEMQNQNYQMVVHEGELIALKRFKDDVKEVAKGYDCGIQIKGYNDIEERDVIESYHEVAIKRNLNSIQNVYNKKSDLSGFF
jgi:translation initiation factor IF-2